MAAALAVGGALAGGGCHLGGPHTTIPVEANDLSAGDVNGDGVVDLVVVGGDTISIFRGDGSGGFSVDSTETIDPSGHRDFTNVALHDLDDDSDLDVAATRWDSTRATADLVVWAIEGGRLGAGRVVGTGVTLVDLALGDVDADGDADLAAVGAEVTVRRNDGSGVFGAAEVVPGVRGSSITMGDLNEDARDDLLVGSGQPDADVSSRSTLQIVFATATGWGAPVTLRPDLAAAATYDIAIADVDGDDRTDVVTANGSTCCDMASVSVLRGQPGGTLAAPVVTRDPGLDQFVSVVTGDFDDDGIADVLAGAGVEGASVFFGAPGGRLVEPHDLVPQRGNAFPVAAADLDDDGTIDAVTGGRDVDVFLNALDGRTHE